MKCAALLCAAAAVLGVTDARKNSNIVTELIAGWNSTPLVLEAR
jgi:hypothetical protein